MAWLLITTTSAIALVVANLFFFLKSYRIAGATGLPVQACLANSPHPIFRIGGVSARDFFKTLPWPLSRFGETAYYGWAYDDYLAGNIHNKLGPIFILASSWGNQLVVSDPEVALVINAKWKAFIKPPTQQAMALFGPNLDTVEGSDWNKHRRLTAPCFNENVSSLVWSESLAQALGMLRKFEQAGSLGVQSLADDTRELALHVLSRVAFGRQSEFNTGSKIPKNHTMSFQRSVQLIIQHIKLCLVFGSKLTAPMFSTELREAGRAFVEYPKYVQEILDDEREKLDLGDVTSNNLVSVMLRSGDADQRHCSSSSDSGFREAEVKGNCFVFIIAGHDTTANSLALTIALLSSRPHIQDWLAEEINAVLGNATEPDYEAHFRRLVRCQAALYETLRLFPAVVGLPKYTGKSFVPIQVNGKEHILPPHLYVLINVVVLHRLPKYWGDDVDEWRTERWTKQSPTDNPNNTGNISKSATTNHKRETIIEPQRGSYMPWAEGPRICPGSRFARVEFVATIATLFRAHKVRPQLLNGESQAQAMERAKRWANDAHTKGIALSLKRPEDVTLVWEARE